MHLLDRIRRSSPLLDETLPHCKGGTVASRVVVRSPTGDEHVRECVQRAMLAGAEQQTVQALASTARSGVLRSVSSLNSTESVGAAADSDDRCAPTGRLP